jgi:hypothetical protein
MGFNDETLRIYEESPHFLPLVWMLSFVVIPGSPMMMSGFDAWIRLSAVPTNSSNLQQKHPPAISPTANPACLKTPVSTNPQAWSLAIRAIRWPCRVSCCAAWRRNVVFPVPKNPPTRISLLFSSRLILSVLRWDVRTPMPGPPHPRQVYHYRDWVFRHGLGCTMERAFGACEKTSCDEVTDPGRDPLTRPAPADEDVVAVHPRPQGGEGWAFMQPLLRLPEVRCGKLSSSIRVQSRR